LKIWEIIVDARLEQEVEICGEKYGCMPGMDTTGAIIDFRILLEKIKKKRRNFVLCSLI